MRMCDDCYQDAQWSDPMVVADLGDNRLVYMHLRCAFLRNPKMEEALLNDDVL